MSAGAIGGVTGAGSTAGRGFAGIKSEDFIRIMISELANQDPLQPQDSAKLLEQLSSLRNIESQMSLQQQLQALVSQNQVASAGNLIGKVVLGLDESNNQAAGLVLAVRVQNGKAVLELDSGKLLPMDRVTQITTLEALGM